MNDWKGAKDKQAFLEKMEHSYHEQVTYIEQAGIWISKDDDSFKNFKLMVESMKQEMDAYRQDMGLLQEIMIETISEEQQLITLRQTFEEERKQLFALKEQERALLAELAALPNE